MNIFWDLQKEIMKTRLKKVLKYFFLTLIFGLISFIILDIFLPFKPKINYSTIITSSDGTIIHAFLNHRDKWRMKTELDEISPLLKKTIIHKEDKYFYFHFGINPIAIGRALFNNIIKRKRTSGASTITMQVARMLQPKKRSYGNKFIEMFRAMQLEWHYSKDEILQMYLNLLPYGGNVEGVKSASMLYFQKKPEALSLAQVITLAIIPNRPTSLKPGENNSFIVQERNKWLKQFSEETIFPQQDIDDAMNEPLDVYRHSAPKMAPHFSIRMYHKFSNEAIIKTTLDIAKQKKLENIVKNYVTTLKNLHITNASVIVINNQTQEVEAYVGSSDFYDSEAQGQVDGINAIRSPGSTLKPLLYALAMDKGIITPKFNITDVPVNFSGYRPENYDQQYRGKITIEKALALSLNIPAVKITDEIGVDYLASKLSSANFKWIDKNQKDLGLSLALGGCGVTLEELSNLFSCFAHEGKYKALRWLKNDSNSVSQSIFSPAASFMVTNILNQLVRPDLPYKFENSMHLPKVAWKTGTSYGRRDGWSIGYNVDYTVGVWIGNFNGEGVPELNGAEYATPLLFDVFNNIDYNSKKWFKEPKEMSYRLVCAETGLLPNDSCKNQIIDYYIPMISSNTKCEHVKQIYTDATERISYCKSCLPESGYKVKWYYNHPPDLLDYFESNNIPYLKIPPHNEECTRIYSDVAPEITSPTDGMEYLLIEEESKQLMLSCNVENGVKIVYWYVDDKLYQSAKPKDKVFFSPAAGQHKISCVDDKGRNTNIRISVKFI
jgi:penicillin-binding protein 1C